MPSSHNAFIEMKQKLEDLMVTKQTVSRNTQRKLTSKITKQIRNHRVYKCYEDILHDSVIESMDEVEPRYIFKLISNLQRLAHKKLSEAGI